MGIGILLAIVAGIVLVVLLVKQLSGPAATTGGAGAQSTVGQYGVAGQVSPQNAAPAPGAETPRDIVQRRYASGDIDREEYLQKLADL